MTGSILARSLGVLLGALGFTLLWNGIQALRTADDLAGYGVLVLQFLAGPIALLAGYRLWRRDRRALKLTALALTVATGAGALAAWTYSVDERSSATFGAIGGGFVFTIAMVLLAHMTLRARKAESSAAALDARNAENADED